MIRRKSCCVRAAEYVSTQQSTDDHGAGCDEDLGPEMRNLLTLGGEVDRKPGRVHE